MSITIKKLDHGKIDKIYLRWMNVLKCTITEQKYETQFKV